MFYSCKNIIELMFFVLIWGIKFKFCLCLGNDYVLLIKMVVELKFENLFGDNIFLNFIGVVIDVLCLSIKIGWYIWCGVVGVFGLIWVYVVWEFL